MASNKSKKYLSLTFIISIISFLFFKLGDRILIPFENQFEIRTVQLLNKSMAWKGFKASKKFVIHKKLFINNFPVAYTDKLVYSRSDSIALNIISPEPIKYKIIHYDHQDNLEEEVLFGELIPKEASSIAIYSNFNGIESPSDKLFFKAKDFKNGWHNFVIYGENIQERNIPFFIEPESIGPIIFVESTDTLMAYNPGSEVYGIIGFYNREFTNLGDAFSFPLNTPIEYKIYNYKNQQKIGCFDHLVNADGLIKYHLKENDIILNSVSDQYLDNYENLKNVKLIIFGSHNEYWTSNKAKNITRFIEDGGSIIFFGGNHAWREITRTDKQNLIQGSNLLHKYQFNQLAEKVLGAYYDKRGYKTSAPYKSLNSQIWKDKFNLDIKNNTVFGKSTNNEHCEGKINGGSGYETDKFLSRAEGFVELAKGLNPNGSGASIVFKENNNGARILNFGSISVRHVLDDEIINSLINAFIKLIDK